MRAFLEKTNKEWLDDFVYISKYPLDEMGVEIIPFESRFGDIDNNVFKKYNVNINSDIVIGCVQSCELFFYECGVEPPKYLGYPPELKQYLNREINIIKVGDLPTSFPYFIKPKDGVKLFTGTLVENKNQLKILNEQYPVTAETELYISEPVNFLSEYRCFIHKGILKGIQWYAGDFKIFPDIAIIENMIKSYKSANVSYTLDVGVMNYGNSSLTTTTLIEVNDMWAIGSYGFDGKKYVRMTIDRFQEIAKTAKRLDI